jgi:hypothetical protein
MEVRVGKKLTMKNKMVKSQLPKIPVLIPVNVYIPGFNQRVSIEDFNNLRSPKLLQHVVGSSFATR